MEAMASEGLRRRIQGAKTIIVKNLLGEVTELEVDLSETIAGVKAMIYEEEGTHPLLQRLIFNGQEANDDHTLEEHGIENGSIIRLVPNRRGGGSGSINIYIRKLDGGIFMVKLGTLTVPIYEVRYMIRSLEGIQQTQQHLVFCGLPLDDDRTLADYNIQENSTLHLALGPRGGDGGLHEVA